MSTCRKWPELWQVCLVPFQVISASDVDQRPQKKRSLGDVAGIWRRVPQTSKWHPRPMDGGRQPLKITDIHRVLDITRQGGDEYEDPLWLVRCDPLATIKPSDDSVGSGHVCAEYDGWRILSTSSKMDNADILVPRRRCTTNQPRGKKSREKSLIKPAAPLRSDWDQTCSQSDVTRLGIVREAQHELRLGHTQRLDKRSNNLPFDCAISPLQRMTNKLNDLPVAVAQPADDGAKLKPGPSAHLPIVRKSTHPFASPSQRLIESPASTCPPFPSISHPRIDLRRASLEPGYLRVRLHSSPAALGHRQEGFRLIGFDKDHDVV